MIIPDRKLIELLKTKEIVIHGLNHEQIQPSSIDLRLGNHFLKMDENNLSSIKIGEEVNYVEYNENEIFIPPHSYILATTKEYLKLPNNITAFVGGRSTITRLGLFVQNTGWIPPGFEGEITLELYNANRVPIQIQSNKRICQLVFSQMNDESINPYRGKYQGQKNATGSILDEKNLKNY